MGNLRDLTCLHYEWELCKSKKKTEYEKKIDESNLIEHTYGKCKPKIVQLQSDLYPLNGLCQVERSIYQVTVKCHDNTTYGEKFYIGLAEPKF